MADAERGLGSYVRADWFHDVASNEALICGGIGRRTNERRSMGGLPAFPRGWESQFERVVMNSKDLYGEYYTEAEVAKLLGIAVKTLRTRRCTGDKDFHPPCTPERQYPKDLFHEWQLSREQNIFRNSSEPVSLDGLPAALRGVGGVVKEFKPEIAPSVYFLLMSERVIYVGQTRNLAYRIGQHSKSKEFERVFFISVPAQYLNEVEQRLIREICPELNRLRGHGELIA